MIETDDMAQLDAAFHLTTERTEPAEGPHFDVNSRVTETLVALYQVFPDAHRVAGQ